MVYDVYVVAQPVCIGGGYLSETSPCLNLVCKAFYFNECPSVIFVHLNYNWLISLK